ncbi:ParB/RepB/Spo0J family partition protein [Clostridium sp. HMP27]|uniref:ParB/RepB/Spo0J family partition protein n=1 Tax=Clostridium sp. HMP27 TaxID=1487921 RepID=UPI00052C17EA|nr:ParB/RepB/Spo0J family partition protein [Clostridium sp. HMP27]KGK86788.1 plasmid stablization protein ParB [Clostridium sp. HMP27]
MSKKFGLGKGLGALIPEDTSEDNLLLNGMQKIDISLIRANNTQPRKSFDEEKIMELSESIKQYGVIQPILITKDDDTHTYTIVAGERRWRAAKLAGIKEVPVIIKELNKKEILEISLIENIQRQDLNPIEEAKAYKNLLEDFKLTQEELSKRVGKSRTAITNCIRLLNLDERVQDYVIDGVLTEGHGRTLLAIENKELQYKISQMIIDDKLSVRETEKLIKSLNRDKEKQRNNKQINNIYYEDIKNKLEELFGTRVVLNSNNDKGKIQIEYYSEEDLQRILDILKL